MCSLRKAFPASQNRFGVVRWVLLVSTKTPKADGNMCLKSSFSARYEGKCQTFTGRGELNPDSC